MAAGVARRAAALLLAWYDRHRRHLPWRAGPGVRPDPFRVWLSEIMLQQTTVVTAAPYFARFIARWPTVAALAAADRDEVLAAWAGLGYYARARNLHTCAQVVVAEHGGHFPDTEDALSRLPGIGPYTAAAVAAIAFDRPVLPVDGNVERVVARLFAVARPLPGAKPALRQLAAGLAPDHRPGDFAQAMMDLGATVCTPRRPGCAICPLTDICAARAAGVAQALPARAEKRARPHRHGVAFWLTQPGGAVLLRRRPDRGLLGGMMEFPSTDWREAPWDEAGARRAAPVAAGWRALPGTVSHVFTHFSLALAVWAAELPEGAAAPAGGQWCPLHRLKDEALPTVMRKVAALAQGAP